MKVKRTTFMVDNCKEKCIIVSNDDNSVQVRISKCYHYIGSDSLYIEEFIDDEWNSRDEINGDFDSLTINEAKRLAIQYSVYLN